MTVITELLDRLDIPTEPKHVGLFEGYSGLTTGIQGVIGGTLVAYSEIEPAMLRVLAHHHPESASLGDITEIDWRAFIAEHGEMHVLSGGFPCQDVSHAGLGAGLVRGTRSGLWYEFARAIRETRPKLVIIENVRGLLSAKAGDKTESTDDELDAIIAGRQRAAGEGPTGPTGPTGSDEPDELPPGVTLRALGAVLGDLSELGYAAEWLALRASDVGAPHGRFRVFIAAYPVELGAAPPARGRRIATWNARRELWEDPNGAMTLFDPEARPFTAVWPAAGVMIDGVAWEQELPRIDMYDLAELLPSPEAKLAESGPDYARMQRERAGGDDLTTAVFRDLVPGTRGSREDERDALLRTPSATEAERGMLSEERAHHPRARQTLSIQMRDMLPTPQANLGSKGGPQARSKRRAGGHSSDLDDAIHELPTPTAADGDRTSAEYARGNPTLAGAAETLMPTPRATRGGSGTETMYGLGGEREDDGRPQGEVLLPTPLGSDGEKGGPNQLGGSGDPRLSSIAGELMPTPSTADADGGHTRRGGARSGEVLLGGIGDLLPSPAARDEKGPAITSREGGPDLGGVVELLPTPNATQQNYDDDPAEFIERKRRDAEKHGTGGVGWPLGIAVRARWGRYAEAVARWERITGMPAPEPTKPDGRNGGHRLSAELPEWMMGLIAGYLTSPEIGLTRREALKAAGNGVVPQQATAAVALLLLRIGNRLGLAA